MSQIVLFDTDKHVRTRLSAPMHSDIWAKYQRNALRYLRATGSSPDTISTLEHLPFSCDDVLAVDQMGDIVPTGDHVLALRVPVEVFVEIESERGSWPNRVAEQIPQVAHALGRVGCTIGRVVAEINSTPKTNRLR
jgi:hypothetical protein